jgi:hypothetical protein
MPDPALSILFMHGTNDALSPYAVAVVQRDSIVQNWSMRQDAVVQSDDQHTWTRWVNDAGTVFEFIEHDYVSEAAFLLGHCYPNGLDYSQNKLPCTDPGAFHWGEAVAEFFVAHPRR